jgi:hypothetical protein
MVGCSVVCENGPLKFFRTVVPPNIRVGTQKMWGALMKKTFERKVKKTLVMPFTYNNGRNINFTKHLTLGRCETCGHVTELHPHCWKHLKETFGLVIKSSSIKNAGLGLWTTRKISRGRQIGTAYGGELLTKQKVDERYGAEDSDIAPYVLKINEDLYRDCALVRSASAYINDVHNSDKEVNAEFVVVGDDAYAVATRAIPAKSEIFINYGSVYW